MRRRPGSPGSGLMQPPTEPTPTAPPAPRGDEDRALPPTPPRPPSRRRARRARTARADRGRLPDGLGDPAAHPARPLRDLRLAARRRHPRGLPARRDRPPRATPRAPRHRRARVAGADRRSTDARRCRRWLCEALRTLASLPERQRSDLTLKVAGYSYEEIRALTPGRTFTNVNKSLRQGPRKRFAARATLGPDAYGGGPNRTAVPLVV